MNELDLCGVCGQGKESHAKLIHQFSQTSSLTAAEEIHSSKTGSNHGNNGKLLMGDPVLRLLLIRKGLLTPEELEALSKELVSSGVIHASPKS